MRASFNAHSLPLLKSLNTLTLEDLYKQQNLIFMHRFVNNLLPLHLRDFFISPLLRVRPSSERLGMMVDIVRYNKQKTLNSYLHRGPSLFNLLPRGVRADPRRSQITSFFRRDRLLRYSQAQGRLGMSCGGVGVPALRCDGGVCFCFVSFLCSCLHLSSM